VFLFVLFPSVGIQLSPFWTAVLGFALNEAAFSGEIIRGGIKSIHSGQIEAGLALGLHKRDVFRFIVLRPAIRAVFPSLTGQFVMLTLTTSIASAIAAYELTSVAKLIENESFRSFEVYGTITLLYLCMSWLMMRMFGLISWRFFSYPVK